jgi:hypothetical protein
VSAILTCQLGADQTARCDDAVDIEGNPWLAVEPHVWLTMNVTGDPHTSTFHIGTAEPILPGRRLNRDGQTIDRGSFDTTLLSRYGAQQARKSQQLLKTGSLGLPHRLAKPFPEQPWPPWPS